MSTNQPPNENAYVFDAESSTETARLMLQERLVTRAMGGTLPEGLDLSDVEYALDIGCGPGGWVLDMAQAHPKIEVTGIDISQTTIRFALSRARSQGLDNARFQVMDATRPLDFSDASFDVVNARLIQGFLTKEAWTTLLQECLRITRPGGIIRVTETEWAVSTSPAHERITELFTQAMNASGRGFSSYGRHIGITPMLERLLHNAGYQNTQKIAHALSYSAGTEAYEGFYQDYSVGFKTVQPFLVKAGVTTQEEIEKIYQQMINEMSQDDFCALWYMLTVWGYKSK